MKKGEKERERYRRIRNGGSKTDLPACEKPATGVVGIERERIGKPSVRWTSTSKSTCLTSIATIPKGLDKKKKRISSMRLEYNGKETKQNKTKQQNKTKPNKKKIKKERKTNKQIKD